LEIKKETNFRGAFQMGQPSQKVSNKDVVKLKNSNGNIFKDNNFGIQNNRIINYCYNITINFITILNKAKKNSKSQIEEISRPPNNLTTNSISTTRISLFYRLAYLSAIIVSIASSSIAMLSILNDFSLNITSIIFFIRGSFFAIFKYFLLDILFRKTQKIFIRFASGMVVLLLSLFMIINSMVTLELFNNWHKENTLHTNVEYAELVSLYNSTKDQLDKTAITSENFLIIENIRNQISIIEDKIHNLKNENVKTSNEELNSFFVIALSFEILVVFCSYKVHRHID
jgi:hypothetical protein